MLPNWVSFAVLHGEPLCDAGLTLSANHEYHFYGHGSEYECEAHVSEYVHKMALEIAMDRLCAQAKLTKTINLGGVHGSRAKELSP